MSLIIDTSATIAWVYADERTAVIRAVFARVRSEGAWVPGLWHLETANVLQMNVRRKRHSAAFRDATLSDLALLPIQVDSATNDQAWVTTVLLAERHHLTVYDAAYLEVAMRRGLPLATLDVELRRAAEAEGVDVLGE